MSRPAFDPEAVDEGPEHYLPVLPSRRAHELLTGVRLAPPPARPDVSHVFEHSRSETGSYAFHAYVWTLLGATIGFTLAAIGALIAIR